MLLRSERQSEIERIDQQIAFLQSRRDFLAALERLESLDRLRASAFAPVNEFYGDLGSQFPPLDFPTPERQIRASIRVDLERRAILKSRF